MVIGKNGLKRIFCPFRVMCVESIHLWFQGDVLFVTAVKLSKELKLVYKIGDFYYIHNFFVIL